MNKWYPMEGARKRYLCNDDGQVLDLTSGELYKPSYKVSGHGKKTWGYVIYMDNDTKNFISLDNVIEYHGWRDGYISDAIGTMYMSGNSVKKIAGIFNMSVERVHGRIQRMGLKYIYKKRCKHCDKAFETELKNQKFCSKDCCDKFHAAARAKKLTKAKLIKTRDKRIISLYFRGFSQPEIAKFIHKNTSVVSLVVYKYNCRKRAICPECRKVFNQKPWSRSQFCSGICARKFHKRKSSHLRRSWFNNHDEFGEKLSIRKLYELEDGVCHICGEKCDPHDWHINEKGAIVTGNAYPSIDHVVPLSKGGDGSRANIRLAHRLCNSYKYNRNDTDWEKAKDEIVETCKQRLKSEVRYHGKAWAGKEAS